jgi:tetratricopeptide (TPR) repeat protein
MSFNKDRMQLRGIFAIQTFLVIILLFTCTTEGISMSAQMSQPDDKLPEFDKLWNFNDPAETEKKFIELLPKAKKSGDTSYYAQLLTQVARTQGLQQKFEKAHKTLDEVENLLNESLGVAKIRYLLERGRVYNSSKEKEKAKPLFFEAWELAKAQGEDHYAVDAAHMMAIVESPDKSIEWNEKAMDYAEKSKSERAKRWLGALYNNLGWTYHDKGEFEKALAIFQKALKWREEHKQERETRIAKWCVARTFRSLNRLAEALAIQEALLQEWEEAGENNGYVFEELGECLLTLKREEDAKKYFALAYEELSKDPWLIKNEAQRLERLKTLAGSGK